MEADAGSMEGKMRPIDADAVLHEIGELKKSPWYNDDSYPGSHAVRKEAVEIVEDLCIKDAPTVDAVEVVRCRECKWWWKEWETCTNNNLVDGHNCATTFKADSFCSYGERRER